MDSLAQQPATTDAAGIAPRPISRPGTETWSQRRLKLFGFTRWGVDERDWSPATRERYAYLAMRVDTWMIDHRGVSLYEAAAEDLRAWTTTLSPVAETRNAYTATLRSFFDWVISTGLRTDNPAKELPRFRRKRSLPKALEPAQARAVLDEAERAGPRWHAAVSLLVYGGLRISELRHLEWNDVQGFTWLRLTGKGSHERDVPLHPEATAALRRWEQRCTAVKWVMPSPVAGRDGPASYSYCHTHIRDFGAAAGIDGLHPHMLRHTAASRLIETGADVRVVQEYLGHSNVAVTSVYLRARPGRVKDAVEALTYDEESGR